MKTIVLDRDVYEEEVKPHALLEEYRGLLAREVEEAMAGDRSLHEVECPGCGAATGPEVFAVYGMRYRECPACKSVYVSPRPDAEALHRFYRCSRSFAFWRERILPATREARRDKLFRPRAQWLLDIVDEYRPEASKGVAVGYHNDLLVAELLAQEENLFRLVVTNEIADLEFAAGDLPGVEIRPTPLADLGQIGRVDAFLAFDILDRCADPERLFTAARDALEPGGLLLATTILISGFDLQVLWDRADGIYPPERMNLLSAQGLSALIERHGFETLEFSTPGVFDVEEVQHAVRADPGGEWPRFVRYLVENGGEEALEALQEYLQRFRLSSFGRVVLRKNE